MAKSGTNQEKPTQFGRAKNLSVNRKAGQTKEKALQKEHEKNMLALNLRRIKMMDEAEKKAKKKRASTAKK